MAAAKDFITRQAKAGKPFFCWWNGTRMHFRTHVKAENRGMSGPGRVQRRHGRARHARRRTAQADRRPRPRQQHHRAVLDRQRPALQHLARRRHHAVPQREELELGRRLSRAVLHPLARPFPGRHDAQRHRRRTRTGCRPSPPPPARPTSRRSCSRACELNGRTYKNHIDGYNLLDYLSGKVKDSPRNEFIYVNDDGADRRHPRSATGRRSSWRTAARRFGVWREPFIELRVPLLFNLRRDPFEKCAAQLEHLPRLDDRPGVRARAAAGSGGEVPADA